MRRYLVVANQTLGGAHLKETIDACVAKGPCTFHILVPATKPSDLLTWTEGQAHELAEERLQRELAWFAERGYEATGEVGDARPVLAIQDAFIARPFDEIILSTLPAGPSRWLRMDLPSRVERLSGLPVTHLIGEPAPAHATAG